MHGHILQLPAHQPDLAAAGGDKPRPPFVPDVHAGMTIAAA